MRTMDPQRRGEREVPQSVSFAVGPCHGCGPGIRARSGGAWSVLLKHEGQKDHEAHHKASHLRVDSRLLRAPRLRASATPESQRRRIEDFTAETHVEPRTESLTLATYATRSSKTRGSRVDVRRKTLGVRKLEG